MVMFRWFSQLALFVSVLGSLWHWPVSVSKTRSLGNTCCYCNDIPNGKLQTVCISGLVWICLFMNSPDGLLCWCGLCLLHVLWLLYRYCTRWFDFIVNLIRFQRLSIQCYRVLLHRLLLLLLLLHWLNVIDHLCVIWFVNILNKNLIECHNSYFRLIEIYAKCHNKK